MKRITPLFFCLQASFAFPQAPAWLWAQYGWGNNFQVVASLAVDTSGNVYSTGYSSSASISFGPPTLTNNGDNDVFLVKHDASGNVVWLKNGGGIFSDMGTGIAVDDAGYIYVTGQFASYAFGFGGDSAFNAGGSADIFLAKLTPAGNTVWITSAGGTAMESNPHLALDGQGNVFVCASYTSDSIKFGTDTLVNVNAGNSEICLMKYDTSGNFIWARSYGNWYNEYPTAITADGTGNVMMVGDMLSAYLVFGTDTVNNTGTTDVFVAKIDGAGNAQWARGSNGSSYEWSYAVTHDQLGNVYIAGTYGGTLVQFGAQALNNNGYDDIFLVKYSPNGTAQWARSAVGNTYERAHALYVNQAGNIGIGMRVGCLNFQIGSYSFGNIGFYDLVMAEFDPSGNVLWASNAGGNNYDMICGMACSGGANGGIYVGGWHNSNPLFFGSTSLSVSSANGDAFVAKAANYGTGMNENANSAFVVSPNPSSGVFNLLSLAHEPVTSVSVYNAIGEKVMDVQPGTLQIDLSAFDRGVYFLRIESGPLGSLLKLALN